ncbi:helix-turn-helix protein [Streptomyces sp. PanSC19]|uniref:helix-turn-helix domain-containing protein n=1 Tax=Streptomyces sp. PanSC19 TaxID=1520455 RepID=UPI000F474690|nr:helix-turn-helix transcriptional regulator [Streptomyces sp. PanSC19]ROQ32486.1 helix-turn-helix protein [Streptomyces sp. PanSC19]
MGDVEEFAARVRALKERDGRSYEALGRRLGVSASTLHRYGSGAAVPESFAVVERLTRLCGATPDETRELEERWRRADLVRRPPAKPVVPVAAGATAPGPGPGSGPAPAPGVASVPAPVPTRPRRGRKAWLVVGVVAGVVALVLGAALLPGHGREPQGAGPRGTEPPLPFTYTVASDLWENGCGHTYLVDRLPARVPAPPAPADAARWAGALGAVDGGQTLVRVTVQGKGASAVVLHGLHVRVAGRAEPLPWAGYRMDEGCGGAVTPRMFTVDLDAPRPLARPVDGYDASGEEGRTLPAVAFPYAVTAAEPGELLVSARAVGCDCRWYLELEWSAQGRSGVVRIADRDGEAFRTSGRAQGSPVHVHDPSKGLWITGSESGQGG